jgi:hypothetical protein
MIPPYSPVADKHCTYTKTKAFFDAVKLTERDEGVWNFSSTSPKKWKESSHTVDCSVYAKPVIQRPVTAPSKWNSSPPVTNLSQNMPSGLSHLSTPTLRSVKRGVYSAGSSRILQSNSDILKRNKAVESASEQMKYHVTSSSDSSYSHIDIISKIIMREGYLRTIKSMIDEEVEGLPDPMLPDTLEKLKDSTMIIVEVIAAWSLTKGEGKPFIWKNKNYLIKLQVEIYIM